jgi:hypothetical protein
VKFNIPVGKNRTITFAQDIWRGFVMVSVGNDNGTIDKPMIIDNYLADGRETAIALPDSPADALSNASRIVLVIAVAITIVLTLAFFIAYNMIVKNSSGIQEFLYKHKATLFIVMMSMIMMCAMVSVSGRCRFYGDELASFEIASQQSLRDMLTLNARMDGNGPFFNFILHFYYKISPYGERWLLLLPEFIMALGVFCIGMCTKSVMGNRGGCFSAIIASTMIVLSHQGNNLRAYPLLVLFTALTLWTYFMRLRHGGTVGYITLYGVCMTGLVYTHLMAAFLCLMLFFVDVVLYCKKIIRFKCFASYLAAGIFYLPWFLFFITHWWYGMAFAFRRDPGIIDILSIIQVMLDGNVVYVFIFCCGIATLITEIIRQRVFHIYPVFPIFLCIIMSILFIIILYSYSVMNTNGSIWEEWYFLVILPMLIMVIAYALDRMCRFLEQNNNYMNVTLYMILAISFFNVPNHYKALLSYPDKYVDQLRESAEWLMWQDDVYRSSTGVGGVTNGWYEYYVEQQGRRDPLNYTAANDDALKYEKLYFLDYWLNDGQEMFLSMYFDLISEQNGIQVWVKKQE